MVGRHLSQEQARIDNMLAEHGDLDAQERVLKRRRIERLRLQDAAEAAAHMQTAAPTAKGTAPAAPAKVRASKGTAPSTLHAIRAIAAFIHRTGAPRGGALGLAKAAATEAATLGLPGADSLNPDGGTMREIARAFLDGIQAADSAPEQR